MGKVIPFRARESIQEKLRRIDSLDWNTWRLNKTHKKILRLLVTLNKEFVAISEELCQYITRREYWLQASRLMNLGFIEYVIGDQHDEPNEWVRLITLYPKIPTREKTVHEEQTETKT